MPEIFTSGPDAFFWVGTEGSPSSTNEDKTFILDPSGATYKYRDQSAPVLGRSEGERIALKMPAGMKVGDLKWISVWCRRFTVDFGNLIFPDNLGLSKSEDSLPHPLAPVDSNDVAPESEPEPESESEPEPGEYRISSSGLCVDVTFPEDDHDHHDHDHHHDHNDVDGEPEPEPRGAGAVLSCPTLYSMVTLLLTSLLL